MEITNCDKHLTAQEQDNILANDILERNYYKYFRLRNNKDIELFLYGRCQAKCEYCYITKYGEYLFPKNLMRDSDKIISNLQTVLNWYVKNKFCCNFELFSAQWLNTPIAPRVFDAFYNAFKNVDPLYRPTAITMPDNMQFLKTDGCEEFVQTQIDRFRDDLGIEISISASVDGKICEDSRTVVTDEFYKRLQEFCTRNNFGYHPCLYSHQAKKWIENMKWWYEFEPSMRYQYILEVRDETWTEENIQDYLKFLDWRFDYEYTNLYDSDMSKYIYHLFGYENLIQDTGYRDTETNVSLIRRHVFRQDDKITCSLSSALHIRLADMCTCLCHRLYYKELEIGHFIPDDEKILTFEATNVHLLIPKIYAKRTCMPMCEACKFVGVCHGYCWGNSYEQCKNFLIPTKEVCLFESSKFEHIIKLYSEKGVFEYVHLIESYMSNEEKQYLNYLTMSILGIKMFKNDAT